MPPVTRAHRTTSPATTKTSDVDKALTLARGALKKGTLVELNKAPAGLKKATPLGDVTPKGAVGAKLEGLLLNGQVLVKSTPVVPNAKDHWYSAGMLPGHKPVPDSAVKTEPRWKEYTAAVKDHTLSADEVKTNLAPWKKALATDGEYRTAINELSARAHDTANDKVKVGPTARAALDKLLHSGVSDAAFKKAVSAEIFASGAWAPSTSGYSAVKGKDLPPALKKEYSQFASYADGDVSVHTVNVMGRPVYVMDAYVDAGEAAGSEVRVYDGRGRSLDIGQHVDPSDAARGGTVQRKDLPKALGAHYDAFVAGNKDKDATMSYNIGLAFPNGEPRYTFSAYYDYGDGMRSATDIYNAAGKRLSHKTDP